MTGSHQNLNSIESLKCFNIFHENILGDPPKYPDGGRGGRFCVGFGGGGGIFGLPDGGGALGLPESDLPTGGGGGAGLFELRCVG